MKVIEYIRKDNLQEYSLKMKNFKSFKRFLEYTGKMQFECIKKNIHANYYKVNNNGLIKILYISNEGVYNTL